MNRRSVPEALRRWLQTLGERCEYCRTSEWVTGTPLEVDHIQPLAKDGATSKENLCRACSSCNTNKGDRTEAKDLVTGEVEPLFNPRQQKWAEHFSWSEDGAMLVGLTACGRVTIETLQMNNARVTRARRLWVAAGWHPPTE